MAFEKSFNTLKPVTAPACIHLRNKAVCLTGDPRTVDLSGESEGHCWCTLTQHVRGPDQQFVTRSDCVAGRSCYRDSH